MTPRCAIRSASGRRGFTLVEVLMVTMIIGLLAAVSIPNFAGQRERAMNDEAKSAVRTAANAAERYYVENVQSYTGLSRTALIAVEPSLADAPWSPGWCNGGGGVYGSDQVLCVAMQSRDTRGAQFEIRRDTSYGSGIVRVCSQIGTSGCRAGGPFGAGLW